MGTEDRYHPWRELRGLVHVEVQYAELEGERMGFTRGHRITLDSTLMQDERRCTLAHELEHVRRGHQGCQPPAIETEVRQAAARRLIPFPSLLAALRWARTFEELIEELWVDEDTALTRLNHLHPSETTKILAMREELHP